MIQDVTLTLSGVAQQLVAPDGAPPFGSSGKLDNAMRTITLQADPANAHVVYVGGSSAVSSTLYGIILPLPPSSIPAVPVVIGAYDSGPIKLSDIWVIGTAGEKLHVLGVLY